MTYKATLKWLLPCMLTLFLPYQALASGGQRFGTDSYSNPADYMFTENNQFMLGGMVVVLDIPFSGSVGGSDPFSASSDTAYFTPNFRYVRRVHEQILLGIELDEPTISSVGYPIGTPAAFVNTNSNQRSLNFGGNIVFQPNKRFAIGFGPDILHRSITVDIKLPTPLAPEGALLNGQATSWTYGWHIGTTAVIGKATILGLSHYSKIVSKLSGTSEYLNLSGPASSTLELPSVTSFSLTQYFSEDWLFNLGLRYSNWNAKSTVIKSVLSPIIGDINIPLDYESTWYASLFTRYFVTKKLALQASATFDHTPTIPVNLSLLLPEGNTVTVGAGIYYKFLEHYTIEVNGGYGFNRDTIVLMNNGRVAQFGIVSDDIYYLSFELGFSN